MKKHQISAFLCFILIIIIAFLLGFAYEAIIFTIAFGLSVLFSVFLFYLGHKIVKRYDIKIKKADEEELRREDDVLLQSVPFLSTIVFVFVNLFIKDHWFKTVLSVFIVIFAISFYTLRALGKIKQSPSYRCWSMMLLAFLFGSYFASLVSTFADKTNLMYSVIFGIDSAIVISLIILFDYVFSKRYGYNSITLWESFLRK